MPQCVKDMGRRLGLPLLSKQQASWAKIHQLAVVAQILPKLWWMIPWYMKYNTPKLELAMDMSQLSKIGA